ATRHFIQGIKQWLPAGNRILVTCRTLDYKRELTSLPQARVQPLTDRQIIAFLKAELNQNAETFWEILTETNSASEGKTRIYHQNEPQADPRHLLTLARNPYILTIMIDIFVEDGQLGQNRAELLTRFTQILLGWAKQKVPTERWLETTIQIEALARLAFEMQHRSGFGTLITTDQIKAVMPKEIQTKPEWPAFVVETDALLALGAAAKIIEMPPDQTSIRFYHQRLQEYFAARYLLKQNPSELGHLWRWPWLEQEMPPQETTAVDALPPPPPTGWEDTILLAVELAPENDYELLRALVEVNPVLAGRCLNECQIKVDETVVQDVIKALLDTVAHGEVALRVRLAAGQIVGKLDDPRVGEMVAIPQGPFEMGQDGGNTVESPRHSCLLDDYRIGKYPVTNTEYHRFIESGGYKTDKWWSEAGWAQKKEERWREPRYWHSIQFNHPNQPVVGISWYECVAYCNWLTEEQGQLYRLPTEAEWEKAARGLQGYRYPWGNRFEPDQLNAKAGPQIVMAPTPIGIYPKGVSHFGVADAVGNVWEWCATQANQGQLKPYPYDTTEDEWDTIYCQGTAPRVLRGGSWQDEASLSTCGIRTYRNPGDWSLNRGFRVLSPIEGT
ncbi:MAG: SUMF1/EgtB/PvdO family nonheme iron enzyme, partial [Chloroflexota bacterium]